MNKIIVAVDGSEHAKNAIGKARDIAEKFDSEIVLVHVAEGIHLYTAESEALFKQSLVELEEAKERSRVILEESQSMLSDFGDKVNAVLLEGDAANTLVSYIQTSDADLVIIGAHGVKGLQKYTLGSVVSRIVHKIEKPILIVR